MKSRHLSPVLPRFVLYLPFLLIFGGFGVIQAQNIRDAGVINTIQATSHSFIDWKAKKLHVELSAPIDGSDVRNRSTLINRKIDELKNLFPPLFPVFLQPIRLDSQHRFGDLMKADPELNQLARDLNGQALLYRTQPSSDLKSVALEYIFPLVPQLSKPLIDFRQAIELDRILEWQPQTSYSGVVIHVEGALPWYGMDRDAELQPALFSRILDEDSRVVLDASRMIPSAAQRWGTVAYMSGPHPEHDTERVGEHPLLTVARAVYGPTPCDVMISRQDAVTLLASESSRRALKEGRVLLVVNPDFLIEETDNQ